MLTCALLVAVLAADTNAPAPLVLIGQVGRPEKPPKPAPAAAFDKIRGGMTLKEVVALLGSAYIPALSGTGNLQWACEDGRTLRASHTTEPEAVLTADGRGTKKDAWVVMRDKDGNKLAIPVKN